MKRGLMFLVVALAVAGGSLLTTTAYAAERTAATTAVSETSKHAVPVFAGHTYLITVDNGTVFQNTYSSDGTHLHAVTLAGNGQGTTIDVTLNIATVSADDQIYFVSWVEPDTTTVSHVMHLRAGTVQIFFTYTNTSGARVGELHNATLRLVR